VSIRESFFILIYSENVADIMYSMEHRLGQVAEKSEDDDDDADEDAEMRRRIQIANLVS
jgi:hypothetical protein